MFTRLLLGISLAFLLLGHSALAEQFHAGPLYDEGPGKVSAVVELPPGVTAKAADFQLRLDDKPPIPAYDMKPFGDAEKGLDLILCIDISGTMTGPPLKNIKEALLTFLAKLYPRNRPHDRIALMTFGTKIKMVTNFGDSYEKLLRAIDNLKGEGPKSKTRLYQALYQALDYFQSSVQLQNGAVPQRRRVMVITDGKDEGSSATPESVIALSKTLGTSIDAVGWGKIAEQYLDSLRLLAENTGGIFIDARPERRGLSDAFEQLYRELTETRSFVVYFKYPVATDAPLTEQVAIVLQQSDGASLVSDVKAKLPVPAEQPAKQPPEQPPEQPPTTDGGKPIPNWLIGLLAALLAILITGLIIGISRRKAKSAPVPVQPEIIPSVLPIEPVTVPPVVTGEGAREARRTRVGVYFPPPGPGRPAALLVGLSGSVEGREFSMEQELLRLGASPDNDIVIENDDYVSTEHASLRYEKGSLLILDRNSRNGTFVNDIRLADTAWPLTPRDRIRIGNATFEVVFPATS